MTLEKEFTLKPLVSGYSKGIKPEGRPYYEQILMYDISWPFALVHIDNFYQSHGGVPIFDALSAGRTVKVRVRFDIIEEK